MNFDHRIRRYAAIGAGVSALLVALGYGFRAPPILVDTALVTQESLSVSVDQEGKARVVDRYVVTAPVSGYAQRINLDVGDSVKQGATLVSIEPQRAAALDPRQRAQAQAHVAAAQANVRTMEQRMHAARAGMELADTNLERVRTLRANGFATVGDEDSARAAAQRNTADWRSAKFAVETAQHELDAARTALQYAGKSATDASEPVSVRAPVTGQVLRIVRQSEGVIAAGEPLLELGDPRTLEVVVDVLSSDAVRIVPNTKVIFSRWGGDYDLSGSVRRIEPVGFTKVSALGVEEQRVWVVTDFIAGPEQWERLGDGYRLEARFVLWEENDVVQVPASALFRENEGWAVFVVVDGLAQKRVVGVGRRNGLRAQILTGIVVGETVVVHPDEQVFTGVRVKAR